MLGVLEPGSLALGHRAVSFCERLHSDHKAVSVASGYIPSQSGLRCERLHSIIGRSVYHNDSYSDTDTPITYEWESTLWQLFFGLYFHFPLILYPRTRVVAESAAQRSSTTWAMGRVVYGESFFLPGPPQVDTTLQWGAASGRSLSPGSPWNLPLQNLLRSIAIDHLTHSG